MSQELQTTGILSVIERAATDPKIDISKMERLLSMQESIMEKQALSDYNIALCALQQELPVIKQRGDIRGRSGSIQYKYALWEDINEIIKPYLAKNGFSLSFRVGKDSDYMTVTGILSHVNGHSEQTTMSLPSDTSGSKNMVQAIGSSMSYGRRYTCIALLNLTTTDEDDDGVAGGSKVEQKIITISIDEAQSLKDSLDPGSHKDFLRFFNIQSFGDLSANKLKVAQDMIAKKNAQLKNKENQDDL